MPDALCSKCGAELVAGTNFCRRCGAPAEMLADPSEQQTAILDQSTPNPITQRMDARATSGSPDAIPPAPFQAARDFAPDPVPSSTSRPSSMRGLVIVGIILATVLAICAAVFVMKRASSTGTHAQLSKQLSYPGARTVLDVGSHDGSGVLQMETGDSLGKVTGWYASTLKPNKTIQVTSTTVIMKNDSVTATLVGTSEGTSIVIKQAPR